MKSNFWLKLKIAASVLFGVAGAVFFFVLGLRVKTDEVEETETATKKAEKAKKDADKLLEDIDKTKHKVSRVKDQINDSKADRDSKAERYFDGL